MSFVEFPYVAYKGYKLPLVPLNIKAQNDWEEIWVFVDSGATYSIFNYKESRRLNIKPKNDGTKTYVKVGDGGYISVYLVKLPVKIENLEFDAIIGFSEELGTGFNIMGRKDFFEKFKVCFDDTKSVIQFHRS